MRENENRARSGTTQAAAAGSGVPRSASPGRARSPKTGEKRAKEAGVSLLPPRWRLAAKMPVLRLAHLLSFLGTNWDKGLSEEELAALCGTTPEVVHADLQLASDILPLWPDQEDEAEEEFNARLETAAKCWYLESPHFLMPPLALDPEEALALLECLAGSEKNPRAGQVMAKVKQSLLPGLQSTFAWEGLARRRQLRLVKGAKPLYDEEQPEERVMELLEKIASGKRLQLTYVDASGEESDRIVDPLGLVYSWGTAAWYLVAYAPGRKDYRTFRLDRIQSYAETGFPADPRPDFSLSEYLGTCWGIEKEEVEIPIKIRFYNDYNVLDRVRKETAGRPFAKLEEEPGGSLLYTDRVSGLKEIRVWLRSFGESAEVLEPTQLREELIASVEQILARYGESVSPR